MLTQIMAIPEMGGEILAEMKRQGEWKRWRKPPDHDLRAMIAAYAAPLADNYRRFPGKNPPTTA